MCVLIGVCIRSWSCGVDWQLEAARRLLPLDLVSSVQDISSQCGIYSDVIIVVYCTL